VYTVKNILVASCLSASVFLVACSTNDDYLQAKTLPPVAVPEGLDKSALGELYPVPQGDGRIATGELKKPLPPTLSGRQGLSEARLQSFDGHSWLVVPKEASATWSQLLIYLRSRQVVTPKQDVINAEVETGWIQESAEPLTAYRYLLRLEGGLQSDLTEIHAVNIKGQAGPIDSLALWPERSEGERHQKWLLGQIAKAMNTQRSLGDSLVASSIELSPKVKATSVDGEPVFELSLSDRRSFHVVENALNQSDFVIYGSDQGRGVFYINESKYVKGRKRSLITRLLAAVKVINSASSKAPAPAYSVEQVLNALPNELAVTSLMGASPNTTGDLLSRVPGYLLVIRNMGDQQRVYLRDGYGRPLTSAKAKVLLDGLKNQLL